MPGKPIELSIQAEDWVAKIKITQLYLDATGYPVYEGVFAIEETRYNRFKWGGNRCWSAMPMATDVEVIAQAVALIPSFNGPNREEIEKRDDTSQTERRGGHPRVQGRQHETPTEGESGIF